MTASATSTRATPAAHTDVPAWVDALLRSAHTQQLPGVGPVAGLSVRQSGRLCLVSATIPCATTLASEQLSAAVELLYGNVARIFAARGATHPIRFWNHIPDIHAWVAEGLDRYMAFNLGRHRAFCTWLGSEQAFPKCMATASGIGCHGQALVIHALASDRAGVAIENPRQVPAYRYSTRYGPRPPCFARATAWVDDCARPLLLLGGTASVRGEASVHVGDLPAQIGETCGNLQALLANATTVAGHAWTASSVRSLRAYLPDVQIADQVERGFRKVFPAVDQIEMVHAQLCRRELLVEVEGVAVADQPRSERCE